PWIVPHENQGMALEDFPDLKRWFDAIGSRDATQRAYAVGDTIKDKVDLATDDEARKHMFGLAPAGTK
ncbi:MAG: thiol:disulfide oxidoreductase, partial [Pseudomonadota bacterium]|nr:thiol:disulfide oxidoreductase [Pseudomonadota bacterium]